MKDSKSFIKECSQNGDFAAWNSWRKRYFVSSVKKIDLGEIDLEKANLEKFDLRNVNLKGVNLRGASLREADLKKARFENVNLAEADLTEADLAYSYFSNVEAKGSIFLKANIAYARMLKCNFSSAIFNEAQLNNTELISNLQNARFEKTVLENIVFISKDERFPILINEAQNFTAKQFKSCTNAKNIIARKKFLLSYQKLSPELMEWWEPRLYPNVKDSIFTPFAFLTFRPVKSCIFFLNDKDLRSVYASIIVLAQKGKQAKKALPKIEKIISDCDSFLSDKKLRKMLLYALRKIKQL